MIIQTKTCDYICDTAEQNENEVSLFIGGEHYITVMINNILSVTGGEIMVVKAPEPTQLERLDAQTAYTAMMTNTLMKENVQ